MRVEVITAASGKRFGDLRPEAAMVKGSLLYSDEVRLVTVKLPALHIQTAQQMRGMRPLLDEVRRQAEGGVDLTAGLIDAIRARDDPAAQAAADALDSSDDVLGALEALADLWDAEILKHVQAGPVEAHVEQLAKFLPMTVGAYARRAGESPELLVPAAEDLRTAWKAGILSIDLLNAERSFEVEDVDAILKDTLVALLDAVVAVAAGGRATYPLFDDRAASVIEAMRRRPVTPGPAGVSQALIATLDSFPMASMDVVLDVRERLRPAATRFRAAMVKAAGELDESHPAEDLAVLVEDLRLREVAPAMAEIEESLHELGARDALLRGWPTVAAGTLGVAAAAAMKAPELAQYVPVAAGLSVAFTGEIAKRRETFRGIERRPLFLLHAAERYLAAGVEGAARR